MCKKQRDAIKLANVERDERKGGKGPKGAASSRDRRLSHHAARNFYVMFDVGHVHFAVSRILGW